MITDGIRNRSTTEISHALQLDLSLLPFALCSAVCEASVPLTTYLLTLEHTPVDTSIPLNVGTEHFVELLIFSFPPDGIGISVVLTEERAKDKD